PRPADSAKPQTAEVPPQFPSGHPLLVLAGVPENPALRNLLEFRCIRIERVNPGNDQATTSTHHVDELPRRQQSQLHAPPSRRKQEVVEHEDVVREHVKTAANALNKIVLSGVKQGGEDVVHLLRMGVAHVEEGLAGFKS